MGVWFCEMEFNCSKHWDELAKTSNSLVRDCDECGKSVHFVNTQEQLEDAAINGKCVAFYDVKDEDVPLRFRLHLRRTWLDNKPTDPNEKRYMTLGLPRSSSPNNELRSFLDTLDESEKQIKK